MIDEKMGVINGGTKIRNGQTIKNNSLEKLAELLAKELVQEVLYQMEDNVEENLPNEPIQILAIPKETFKQFNAYDNAVDFDKDVPIFLSYNENDDAVGGFNSFFKEFDFSYFWIKECIEKYGKDAPRDIIPVVLHELTHMTNMKSSKLPIHSMSTYYDDDIAAVTDEIFYIFSPTEMNARVSEFWGLLKNCSYSKFAKNFGNDTNIAHNAIHVFRNRNRYTEMLQLIKMIENCSVKDATPNSRDNLLVAILKTARGRNLGYIKIPSMAYVFGTQTKVSDEEYDQKQKEALNNGDILKFFSQDNRNKFNDFGKGKLTQEYAEQRLEEVKQKLVSQLNFVANNFYKRLGKVVIMWIEYRKKLYAQQQRELWMQMMNNEDMQQMVNECISRILAEREIKRIRSRH